MKFLATTILVLFFSTIDSHAQLKSYPWQNDFEDYVQGLMNDYKVPAFAIAVVGPNGSVLQVTKGLRNIEKNLPVTNETLFAIGSTSKAFTGVLLAQLYDQGLVNFDVPVQTYRPDFAIQDSAASKNLTLRDLMGHWTGIGRHDFAWYHRELNREQMFSLIPFLDVSTQPRTEFIYNNWMWVASGIVAETVSKKSWEVLLQQNIFNVLDMSQSNSSLRKTLNSVDYSEAYESDGNQATRVPFLDIGFANPAGGIYSNLKDMTNWVQFHLNHGRVGNQQVISQSALEETYKPFSKINEASQYAMGWAVLSFAGNKLLTHDGGIDGFTSNVSFMPDKGLGIVILTNSSQVVPQMVAFNLWQRLMEHEPKDFVRESIKGNLKQLESDKESFPDLVEKSPSLSLYSYVGKYCHPAYGSAEIKLTQNLKLHVLMNGISTDLVYVGDDTFQINGMFSQMKKLRFEEVNGVIHTLEWQLEATMSKPIRFTRCN